MDRTTGDAALRLFASRDGSGTIAVGGPAVVATVDRPGAVVGYRFTGSAGTSVALTASAATLPDQCGVLELRDPDGTLLASGCVINGAGDVDATVLPATGTYTVVVNPSGTATGQVTRRPAPLDRPDASIVAVQRCSLGGWKPARATGGGRGFRAPATWSPTATTVAMREDR